MSESNIGVRITADVADLNAKLALAGSELRAFNTQTRALADQMRGGGDAARAQFLPQLQAAASAAARAKAEVAGLKDEIRQASSAGANANLGSMFDQLKAQAEGFHGALGAALAGGEFLIFKQIATEAFEAVERLFTGTVEKAIKFDLETAKVAAQLGVTSGEAAALSQALRSVGSSADAYTTMALKLDRQIKSNEERLTALGLATRDENGHLLAQTELMKNAITTMQGYRAGSDQNTVALQLFGRGAKEVFDVMRVTDEETKAFSETLREMGVSTAPEAARNSAELEKSVALLRTTFDDFGIALGQRIGPEFHKLIDFIRDVAGPAMNAIRVIAEGAFAAIDLGFTTISTTLQTVQAAVLELNAAMATLGRLMVDVLTGDFSRMQADWASGLGEMKREAARAFDEILATGKEFAARMANLAGGPEGKGDSLFGSGDKTAPEPSDKGAPADKGAPTQFQEWRDALVQKQITERNFFKDSKEDEQKYWQEKLAQTKDGSRLQFEVRQQVYALDKALALQDRAGSLESNASLIQSDLDYFAQKANGIKLLFDLGKINADQEIAQLNRVEQERFAKLRRDLEEKQQFYAQDTIAQSKVFAEIEKLKREHDARMDALNLQAAQESRKAWNQIVQPIQTAFDGMLRGILTGTQTASQAMQHIAQNIALSFINASVSSAAQWILGEKTMTEGTIAACRVRTAAVREAAVEGRGEQAAAGQKSVLTDAYRAAAGAYAATDEIPVVGPFLAPGAAAIAFSAVEVFGAAIPSAAGGFDIPAGANPLTQLHQREMVLPERLADRVRNMTDDSGASGGGGDIHLNFNGPSDREWFLANKDHIAEALASAHRNYHPSLRSGPGNYPGLR